jgi:hypothetical protein
MPVRESPVCDRKQSVAWGGLNGRVFLVPVAHAQWHLI